MKRDFETLYYEQQANFTESNGMLHQENEGLRKKVEALTAALADEKSRYDKLVAHDTEMLAAVNRERDTWKVACEARAGAEEKLRELRSYAVCTARCSTLPAASGTRSAACWTPPSAARRQASPWSRTR
jgi:hypothetical protein